MRFQFEFEWNNFFLLQHRRKTEASLRTIFFFLRHFLRFQFMICITMLRVEVDDECRMLNTFFTPTAAFTWLSVVAFSISTRERTRRRRRWKMAAKTMKKKKENRQDYRSLCSNWSEFCLLFDYSDENYPGVVCFQNDLQVILSDAICTTCTL